MIYTQSTHSIGTTTPNDYTVPRLSYKAQFSDHVTSFPATMTRYFLTKTLSGRLRELKNKGGVLLGNLKSGRSRRRELFTKVVVRDLSEISRGEGGLETEGGSQPCTTGSKSFYNYKLSKQITFLSFQI